MDMKGTILRGFRLMEINVMEVMKLHIARMLYERVEEKLVHCKMHDFEINSVDANRLPHNICRVSKSNDLVYP